MMTAASPCRTYIVYDHGLFAQGVRSVLEARRAVQIVGMESDVAKALKAVQSLQPEVIIVEECAGKHQPMRLGAFLHSAWAGRVVTLSLNHDFATVYQRNRIPATDPAELVKAIQGVGKQKSPGADQARESVSREAKLRSDLTSYDDRTDDELRLRRLRTQEKKKPDTTTRVSRGRGKGG
jgi:DNA-binding NarL/FixJ family response regulator